jgi:hypothetical protein
LNGVLPHIGPGDFERSSEKRQKVERPVAGVLTIAVALAVAVAVVVAVAQSAGGL